MNLQLLPNPGYKENGATSARFQLLEKTAALEAQHGELPLTPRVRTGGGGWHYYFAWPDLPPGRPGWR